MKKKIIFLFLISSFYPSAVYAYAGPGVAIGAVIVFFTVVLALFADIPDIYEIIGSLIIVGSGIYIIIRETKIGVRPYIKEDSRFRDQFNRGH